MSHVQLYTAKNSNKIHGQSYVYNIVASKSKNKSQQQPYKRIKKRREIDEKNSIIQSESEVLQSFLTCCLHFKYITQQLCSSIFMVWRESLKLMICFQCSVVDEYDCVSVSTTCNNIASMNQIFSQFQIIFCTIRVIYRIHPLLVNFGQFFDDF